MSLALIRSNIKRLIEGLPKLAAQAAESGAEIVLQSDQNLLFPSHGYYTGALHDAQVALQVEKTPTRVVWAVGTDQEAGPVEAGRLPPKDYDLHVEYGTSRMAEIPHLRPALDENREAVHEKMAGVMRDGIATLVK